VTEPPTFIRRTEAELEAQRARLLAEAGLTYEELRDRAATWNLSPEQQDIWHTIEGIGYLLTGQTRADQ
jgi:hypothetical protein